MTGILGMWTSRELVTEAKLGTGSTFRFTLPLIDLDNRQDS
jgi:hypothetical protein